MKKLYVIAQGDILSFRLSSEAHFNNRDRDETEINILKAFSEKGNLEDVVSHLAAFYSCSQDEVKESISDLSFEMYEDREMLAKIQVSFWQKEKIAPTHIIAELTSRCNMSCRHCYGSFGHQHLPEIDPQEWKKLLFALLDQKMEKQAVQLLNITGGEPTMKEGILEILEWSGGKYGVSLFTNCQHLDHDLLNVLRSHPTLIRINTSFDSAKASVDELIRGKGFCQRLQNLLALNDLSIPITINIDVWKRDPNDIVETIKFFSELKNTTIFLNKTKRQGRARRLNDSYFLTEKEYGILAQRITSELNDIKDRFQFEGFKDQAGSDTNDVDELYRCNCGYGVIVIDPQGILKPCVNPLSFFKDIGAEGYIKKLLEDTCEQTVLSLINSVCRDIPIKDLRKGCALPCLISQDTK